MTKLKNIRGNTMNLYKIYYHAFVGELMTVIQAFNTKQAIKKFHKNIGQYKIIKIEKV